MVEECKQEQGKLHERSSSNVREDQLTIYSCEWPVFISSQGKTQPYPPTRCCLSKSPTTFWHCSSGTKCIGSKQWQHKPHVNYYTWALTPDLSWEKVGLRVFTHVPAHAYLYLLWSGCMCAVYVCMKAKGQPSLPCVLRQDPPLNLELIDLARLVGQGGWCLAGLLTWILGFQSQLLMLVWQTLYQQPFP